jgi:hypothetical protein
MRSIRIRPKKTLRMKFFRHLDMLAGMLNMIEKLILTVS